jgi:hypothetical protein
MRNIKEFCFRGLICMGFGPIVYGTIMCVLYLCGVDTLSNGLTIFKGIISTSIMAFLIAGVSIIWQKERIPLGLKIGIHCLFLYTSYLVIYLLNDWIVKDFKVIGIFTIVFVLGYALVWLFIYLVEKQNAKKLNSQIR